MTYCVVGGGISGLTTAYRLRAAVGEQARIVLFDPAERLGGLLCTEQIGGQPMDVGAEAFLVRRPEVPALLTELGLTDRQLSTTGVRPVIYSQAQSHRLPSGTVIGIPSTATSMAGLVDDATVARIAGEPSRQLTWQCGSDPAVAELVADRFGEQVVARSVDPLLCGVYAGSAAGIGVRSAAPGVAAALDRGAVCLTDAVRQALPSVTDAPIFGALDGGYRVLVDELVRRGRPQWVQAGVAHIRRGRHGWTLRDDAGADWHADTVVLAVPASRLTPLLADIAPAAATAANRIASSSAAVVALALPGATPFPRCSGVLVASGERLRVKAITLSSQKWGLRGDVGLLRLSFGRFDDAAENPALSATDQQLITWALADLATVFGVEVEPIDVCVRRWLELMPQYGPGHADVVAQLHAGLPSSLAVAGNYLEGIGVPACIASAGRAVARVLGALENGMAR
ncbi:MAG: protoporphyrinogen oxidase [Mycobacteriaceae bacterium]|nr:protoporphyrinogen oxidase [Mycobacteriaceae bacterium]